MRMGILIVSDTFGADMKWHPHIHLIVTAGGLSLDGKRWIATDPKFLMHQDYVHGANTSYMTLKVYTFIGRLIRHIADKRFPMIPSFHHSMSAA